MEQVAANHGNGIKDIRAPCVDALLTHPPEVPLPTTFQEFYNFPEVCGFEVDADFTLLRSRSINSRRPISFFIQGWLFFGPVSTVIQVDKRPVLSFNELLNFNNLSTEHLHKAIAEWTEWELSHEEGLSFRMIQVGWVLDWARQIIQKNFAYQYPDTDPNVSTSGEKNGVQPFDNYVSDNSILILMCLGETLSAAKARIVEQAGVDIIGWHGDGNIGWGPPKYVFDKMDEEGWCPRAVTILRGQVNSNATMLVAAYQAYRNTQRLGAKHKDGGCTPEECKVKSSDKNGRYQSRHIKGCVGKNCTPCGPPLASIIAALHNDHIPLLECYRDSTDDQWKFRVIQFNPERDVDKKFVTISHVWSDGWGNEGANELNRCQIDFICRQIKRATLQSDTPFWMDTLIVPVARDQKEERQKAIRQILKVFSSSTCTIILDNGLSAMDRGGPDTPAEAAMKIISSVWMRRLWTLLEAYLSREIYIPFEETEQSANNLVTFENLYQTLEERMKLPTSGITQMVRSQLSSMIMGGNRLSKEAADETENSPMLVVNAYRAARWRVSYLSHIFASYTP